MISEPRASSDVDRVVEDPLFMVQIAEQDISVTNNSNEFANAWYVPVVVL